MLELAEIREQGPFLEIPWENPMTGRDRAVPRRDPDGGGHRDQPAAARLLLGAGSDVDPRHAGRGPRVLRRVHQHGRPPARPAAGDRVPVVHAPAAPDACSTSVDRICAEVLDGFCEDGSADIWSRCSPQPFPLLVICDMMGIPCREFQTVLDATNVILGAGDPEMVGDGDLITALFTAGMQLTELMNELAEHPRKSPADDLTSALVSAEVGEDMLAPEELGAFFILLAVAGNDTTRTAISHGMDLLSRNPAQRARSARPISTGSAPTAVEEIVRVASPVTFMRRTATGAVAIGDHSFVDGDKFVYSSTRGRHPRPPGVRRPGDLRRPPQPQQPRRLRQARAPLLPRRPPGPAEVHAAAFRRLLRTRFPDIETTSDPCRSRPWASRWSAASSASRCSSPRRRRSSSAAWSSHQEQASTPPGSAGVAHHSPRRSGGCRAQPSVAQRPRGDASS